MNTNIRPENTGVYELNCKIAKALNLPHKQELDKKERASGDWDQRSVHIRVHYKDRLKPFLWVTGVNTVLTVRAVGCRSNRTVALVGRLECALVAHSREPLKKNPRPIRAGSVSTSQCSNQF
ncbi:MULTISPECIES: hypothetical protein [unclassified Vibrio]|uniref:hypothetical protein n=1 Tax=unclassified Vibrio TaxID=2614977 RepID=UPI00113FD239|nr:MULTISPECIES: hypothetical protein [unclassified Vibrio]